MLSNIFNFFIPMLEKKNKGTVMGIIQLLLWNEQLLQSINKSILNFNNLSHL